MFFYFFLKENVGFYHLPDQINKKNIKRGFEFTLLVVGKITIICLYVYYQAIYYKMIGDSGLGKTTLLDSLFGTDLIIHKNSDISNLYYFNSCFDLKITSIRSNKENNFNFCQHNISRRKRYSFEAYYCGHSWLWK